MKALIDKWQDRKSELAFGASCLCASELQAYIDGLWTQITDDPDTWPDEGNKILMRVNYSGDSCMHQQLEQWVWTDEYMPEFIGSYYRPLCDLDYPPPENKS